MLYSAPIYNTWHCKVIQCYEYNIWLYSNAMLCNTMHRNALQYNAMQWYISLIRYTTKPKGKRTSRRRGNVFAKQSNVGKSIKIGCEKPLSYICVNLILQLETIK